jgi:hypothetical protein
MVALVVLHLAAHGLVLPPPRLLSNLAIPGRTGLEVPVTADVSVIQNTQTMRMPFLPLSNPANVLSCGNS